jgi:hypothetical protein
LYEPKKIKFKRGEIMKKFWLFFSIFLVVLLPKYGMADFHATKVIQGTKIDVTFKDGYIRQDSNILIEFIGPYWEEDKNPNSQTYGRRWLRGWIPEVTLKFSSSRGSETVPICGGSSNNKCIGGPFIYDPYYLGELDSLKTGEDERGFIEIVELRTDQTICRVPYYYRDRFIAFGRSAERERQSSGFTPRDSGQQSPNAVPSPGPSEDRGGPKETTPKPPDTSKLITWSNYPPELREMILRRRKEHENDVRREIEKVISPQYRGNWKLLKMEQTPLKPDILEKLFWDSTDASQILLQWYSNIYGNPLFVFYDSNRTLSPIVDSQASCQGCSRAWVKFAEKEETRQSVLFLWHIRCWVPSATPLAFITYDRNGTPVKYGPLYDTSKKADKFPDGIDSPTPFVITEVVTPSSWEGKPETLNYVIYRITCTEEMKKWK